jgi:hypothetical protein
LGFGQLRVSIRVLLANYISCIISLYAKSTIALSTDIFTPVVSLMRFRRCPPRHQHRHQLVLTDLPFFSRSRSYQQGGACRHTSALNDRASGKSKRDSNAQCKGSYISSARRFYVMRLYGTHRRLIQQRCSRHNIQHYKRFDKLPKRGVHQARSPTR